MRVHLWLLAAIAVMACALRCHGLHTRSLWFDEAFSWQLSRGTLLDVVARSAQDNHPPLYFLALKAWRSIFGDTPGSLRSLSVLFGALATVGAYLLLKEAWPTKSDDTNCERDHAVGGGRSFSLLSAALVAVKAFQVRWGWEARMYALGAALVSVLDTNIFHPRYFVFASLFLCVAMARATARIADQFLATVVALAIWMNAIGATICYCDDLMLSRRPRVRGACRYIVNNSHQGEPVILATPLLYLPVRYHLEGSRECYLFREIHSVRHYEGAAVMGPADCISREQLAGKEPARIWVINGHSGPWRAREVGLPYRWKLVSRQIFREAYDVQGVVEVLEYGDRHLTRTTESRGAAQVDRQSR